MSQNSKHAKKRIIIAVEDNAAFADVLRVYMEEHSRFQLLHFTSSHLALDFLRKFPEDVVGIVSDIMMKDVDGFEFLDQVRQTPTCARLPFIFISGVDTNVFRDLFRNRRFTAFLAKPLGYEEFIRAVTEHFISDRENQINRVA